MTTPTEQPDALRLAKGLRDGTLLLSERDEAAEWLERLHADREADREAMRMALVALEGATKIIVRVDKGITTLARQEADPLSGLNDVRAAISSLKARTQ